MGGHWYRLDGCYRGKRRWKCARGCAARIHTVGKRLVFSDLRHRLQVVYNNKGYPKLTLNGYYYRPHNAYRNQPKVLWYCAARNKYQCPARLRTINRSAPAIYVPSRTGKFLLLHDGYTFYLKNLQAHGRKQWYCSSRDMAGCRADVITAPSNTARYVMTGRGGRLLYYDGNTFFINSRKRQDKARLLWYCSSRKSRNCPASILTLNDRVLGQAPIHTHPPKRRVYRSVRVAAKRGLSPVAVAHSSQEIRYTVPLTCIPVN
ncbi:hypothetical protein RR46_03779 [Papilio xuthus]|uniref:FLYWCH-type domain-containing protein n=1 Tax=Papilio xuthus TaxID=66420 RepID=A0A194Q333_PAPXU|nr:hypothetical protein RR46_03779 [Papilio xuthus]